MTTFKESGVSPAYDLKGDLHLLVSRGVGKVTLESSHDNKESWHTVTDSQGNPYEFFLEDSSEFNAVIHRPMRAYYRFVCEHEAGDITAKVESV